MEKPKGMINKYYKGNYYNADWKFVSACIIVGNKNYKDNENSFIK
jgi:hypothetical protein